METFESGDQSGDFEYIDSENVHFPRVDAEKWKRHSSVSPLSCDFGLPTGLCNHEWHLAPTLTRHWYIHMYKVLFALLLLLGRYRFLRTHTCTHVYGSRDYQARSNLLCARPLFSHCFLNAHRAVWTLLNSPLQKNDYLADLWKPF